MPSKKQKRQQSSPLQASSQASSSSKISRSQVINKRKPANFLLLIIMVVPLLFLCVFLWSPNFVSSSSVVTASSTVENETAKNHVKIQKVAKAPILPRFAARDPVSILQDYPHDASAFTQGLVVIGDKFYESTGLTGFSSLRHVQLSTGEVLKKHSFPNNVFAEGLTVFNNKIYVITWKNKVGYVFDMDLKELQQWQYQTDGWGLTHNHRNLIMSDGSNKLYFIQPDTFKLLRTLAVKDLNGNPVRNLNELEFINGYIYANIWYSRDIAIIEPKSGTIVRWLDCSQLPQTDSGDAVLNGIAYNNETGDFYLTGKLWPRIYKVRYDSIVLPSPSPDGDN